METILYILGGLLFGSASVYSYLRYGRKWVNIKDIPEEDILKVADKVIGQKMEEAQRDIEENKKKAEERLMVLRKESQEHEGLLIEREKKLNERTKILDKKSEELEESG